MLGFDYKNDSGLGGILPSIVLVRQFIHKKLQI